jgi:hypothetical protein
MIIDQKLGDGQLVGIVGINNKTISITRTISPSEEDLCTVLSLTDAIREKDQ